MALYQNTSVDSDKLFIGNYKIEIATVGNAITSTWTNLGAGIVNSFGHNVEKYDVQAGNAPDPISGISKETFSVKGELIEYDGEDLVTAWSGIITSGTSTTTLNIITGGGLTTMNYRALKLTNRRMVSGISQETVIVVYKGTMNQGVQFTAKSDNDKDPINVMPFEFEGVIDGTRTAGDQLFTIQRWLD